MSYSIINTANINAPSALKGHTYYKWIYQFTGQTAYILDRDAVKFLSDIQQLSILGVGLAPSYTLSSTINYDGG